MEYLNPVLFNIMTPIVREISAAGEINPSLRRLAKEAAKMIKKSLGNEEYTMLLSRVQQNLDIKKAERKKLRTQQVILCTFLRDKKSRMIVNPSDLFFYYSS